jgi:hypothetical protein
MTPFKEWPAIECMLPASINLGRLASASEASVHPTTTVGNTADYTMLRDEL